jgi:hypothetical protein
MSTVDPRTFPETVGTEAGQRRAEAVEISGWGARFHFVQPHNLSFWVYLALTAIGAFQAWAFFAPDAGFYAEGFAVAAVLCGCADSRGSPGSITSTGGSGNQAGSWSLPSCGALFRQRSPLR